MSTDAFALATKLISGRDKTTAQVREALERKGFARDGLEEGWVGDALLGKLTARGLDERTATEAISAAREELGFVDRSAAMALLRKRKLEGAKAARFLASRGFSEELVEQLIGSE